MGTGKNPVDCLFALHRKNRIQNQVQISLHQGWQVIGGNTVTVIRNAVLGKIVSPDPLTTVSGTGLHTFGSGMTCGFLPALNLQQFRFQNTESNLTVADLRPLLLTRNHEPARLVQNPHGGIGTVDILSAGTG